MIWLKDEFVVSDDAALLQSETVYELLSNTYWASTRTKESVEASIQGSMCFGLYQNGKQIGFARVVTDKAVFSWIMDVVVHEDYRGMKLGHWLMECILDHPEIKHTAFGLATKDAQEFYRKFGFTEKPCMARPVQVV